VRSVPRLGPIDTRRQASVGFALRSATPKQISPGKLPRSIRLDARKARSRFATVLVDGRLAAKKRFLLFKPSVEKVVQAV